MPKINLKNTAENDFLNFVKETKISYKSEKKILDRDSVVELVSFSPQSKQQKTQVVALLQNYGLKNYHNTTLHLGYTINNTYNYSSNQYENLIREVGELSLPLYYIENTNPENEQFNFLKSLKADTITKKYIMDVANMQQSINLKTTREEAKMRNILFGDQYETSRSKKFLNEFCYYNNFQINTQGSVNFLRDVLRRLNFLQEIFGGIISDTDTIDVNFNVNNSDDQTTFTLHDLLGIIDSGRLETNTDNKIILGPNKKTQNHISTNFNRVLLKNFFHKNNKKLIKTFAQVLQNEECHTEFIFFRVDKFLGSSTTPIQSFWMFDTDLKEYFDYQIKHGSIYRYQFVAYTIIYGIQTEVAEVVEKDDAVHATFVSRPSYKIALANFGEEFIKVMPKVQLPPFVQFMNESNAQNYVKIYLDLDNSSMNAKFIPITEEDASLIADVKTDLDGNIDFEYEMQHGLFEVFRSSEKPKSYEDFANMKTLDVKNKINSTSIVFKDNVIPNKKYYYIFRALNVVGVPSNPTPIYEVELIKDAQKSKVISKVITLETENMLHDKKFKNLLQIQPAFQQRVFNDRTEAIENMQTFKKKINDLTLGTATDKVWGKKFKIRVKSKDTGKIVDLNVKFNLIKDNI